MHRSKRLRSGEQTTRQQGRLLPLLAVFFMSVAVCGVVAGARVNTTRSIPVGLYRATGAPVTKGAYVFFCPPPRAPFDLARARGYISAGPCRGGYGHLMKRVAAVHGDVVRIADDGVWVNGQLLAHSAQRGADRAGQPLPRYVFGPSPLGPGEVLLMSDGSPTSFDGRYFGPIPRACIQTVIRPVMTWDDVPRS